MKTWGDWRRDIMRAARTVDTEDMHARIDALASEIEQAVAAGWAARRHEEEGRVRDLQAADEERTAAVEKARAEEREVILWAIEALECPRGGDRWDDAIDAALAAIRSRSRGGV